MGLTRPLLPLSRAAMLIATAFIGACASVQPKSAAVAFNLPPEFVTENQAAYSASDFWWHAFGDARLDAFVNTALEKNPGLAQALARSRMAEAQVRLTAADPLPQIGIGAGSSRGRQNIPNLAGHTAPIIGSNYDVALDVSWELDMWGRLSALTASARADYLASTEQLRGMRQSVAAQAVQRYFEIVHAYAQVELSERTTEALGEMARQINNRIDVGITSPADGMLANANLESARAGLEQRREGLERSLRQLQILMGDYPSGNVDTALSLPVVPSAPAGGVPAELLARRPDVRAAELGLLSAGYQLEAAQRSFLPSLSLTGSAGYTGSEFADLFSGGSLIWSIAGRVLQPVFEGGRLVAQVDVAEGRRDEAVSAYAETALVALSEVESALAVDSLLAWREGALDQAASAAEEAVTVSLNRYLQGIDPFLNVLESQQRALDGRSAQITARHARLENRIALHLALGGGFEDASSAAESAALPAGSIAP